MDIPSTVRVLLGFLIAPGAPGLLLYCVNLHFVARHDAEFGGVILGICAYVASAILGIPAYFLAIRWKLVSLPRVVELGVFVGLVFYLALLAIIAQGYGTKLEHFLALLDNSQSGIALAIGYASATGAIFWLIAIKSNRTK